MWIDVRQPVLFEQPRKKFLGEVLRIFWSVAPLSNIRIEGVPVGAAQLFQGLGSARRVALPGREHDAPVSGLKMRRPGRRVCALALAGEHELTMPKAAGNCEHEQQVR